MRRLKGVQTISDPATRVGVFWVELLLMRSDPRRSISPV